MLKVVHRPSFKMEKQIWKSHPLIYVVVVNWNRCQDTLECLDSLSHLTYPNFRLLVVDNGSNDGSVQAITQRFPTVELLTTPCNLGFSVGYNLGIRHALGQGSDFVLVLNNDTVVDSRLLDELVKYASLDVGVLAPKIYYYHKPNCIWSVGGQRHPLTLEMTDKGTGQLDRGQWAQVQERDYLVGCALLIRCEVFERVGFFDERFFAYYEDMDFCLRTKQSGYRLLLVPQARVWHKVAATSGGSNSPAERYGMAKGSVLFFRKHVRGLRWLIVIPYRLGSAIKTILRLLMQGRKESAWAYLRGLRDGLRA